MALVLSYDPTGGSSLSAAATWISATMLGTVGTSLAVISIAGLGFEMLGGRLSVRRGVTMILGCFILFGAPAIAAAFIALARDTSSAVPVPVHTPSAERPLPSKAPPPSDPYAGA